MMGVIDVASFGDVGVSIRGSMRIRLVAYVMRVNAWKIHFVGICVHVFVFLGLGCVSVAEARCLGTIRPRAVHEVIAHDVVRRGECRARQDGGGIVIAANNCRFSPVGHASVNPVQREQNEASGV